MRITFTPGQVTMLIERAERQLEQIVADSRGDTGHGRNIARTSHHALHETVVTLTRLYREQVEGGAAIATRIARAYAKGSDAQSGAPTVACVRTIQLLVRGEREAAADAANPSTPPSPAAPDGLRSASA